MNSRKSIPPPVIQPVKCRGCVWGKWQDTVQVCSRPVCVKEEGQIAKRLGISREVPT